MTKLSKIFTFFVILSLISLSIYLLSQGSIELIYVKIAKIILIPFLFILPFSIKKKIIFRISLVAIIVSCLILTYYFFLSTSLESQIYLHNKYKIKFSDLKVTETTKYKIVRVLFSKVPQPRSAYIKYKNHEIETYYKNNQWNDDFDKVLESYNKELEIINNFNLILGKYTNNYFVNRNIDTQSKFDQSYNIVVYLQDVNSLNKLISSLDQFISDQYLNKTYDIKALTDYAAFSLDRVSYNLYISKDSSLFNLLANNSDAFINFQDTDRKQGFVFNREIHRLETTTKMHVKQIDIGLISKGFKPLIFENNGDITKSSYIKDINSIYKYIIFIYNSEINFIKSKSQCFAMYGLS